MRRAVGGPAGRDIVEGDRLSDFFSDHSARYVMITSNVAAFNSTRWSWLSARCLDLKAHPPHFDHATIRDTAVRLYDNASDLV